MLVNPSTSRSAVHGSMKVMQRVGCKIQGIVLSKYNLPQHFKVASVVAYYRQTRFRLPLTKHGELKLLRNIRNVEANSWHSGSARWGVKFNLRMKLPWRMIV